MPSQDDSMPLSDRERRYTLFLLVLVFTSSHVDRQIVAILAQPIKEAFAISDTQLGLLTGFAFALFYATLGMPMAMWADRGNRRNLIALSTGLWSVMTALCAAAGSFGQLLAARIGVGVGEAGSNPPSHSIISDLYPAERRGTAMAIFATGVNAGIMVGYLVGGWGNQLFGWRMAFVLAGVPGIFLALLVRYSIREPARILHSSAEENEAPPFMTVVKAMWASPVLRHTVIAGSLASFAGYATIAWIPSYFVRVHGMSTGQAGTVLALILGIGGAIGTFGGGWLADRWAARGEGWRAWIICLSVLIYAPFALASYLAPTGFIAGAAFLGPGIFGGVYIGIGFAIIQSQVTNRMRAVAASINLFLVNIIGLGFGPTTVGIISDLVEPSYGTDSLRVGLVVMIGVMIWASLHYFRVGQLLNRTPPSA